MNMASSSSSSKDVVVTPPSSSSSRMLPVGITLLIIWLTPCNIASLFFLILCLLLIFHMYNQGRAREHRRIRHEERQNADHGKRNEFESVQWLNLVFENLWPRCLERFTSQEFFIPIAPWFINTYKPKLVKKAVLQHLNLGTQPPKFNSMRVLEQPNESNDHHLVLETLLQFITGENMSARLSVCFFKGIRGTFDISKFQIEGKMKLKVKFINGWPVIGRIQISFVDKPDVRLIARTNGLDLQFLPGANNWLERIVSAALKESVVEPHYLVVDTEMLVKNMTVPKFPGVTAKWFSVENSSPPIASVWVEILDVQDPQSDGKHGQWNPFIEISMGANPAKTLVKRKSTNAKWDRHQLQITNWEMPNILILHVFSGTKGATDVDLGQCVVWINDHKDGEWHVLTHPLQHIKGQLKFAVKVEHDRAFQTTGCQELPRQGSFNSQPITEEETPATTSTIRKPCNRPSVNRSKSDTQLHSKLPSKEKRMPQFWNKPSASTSAQVDADATLPAPDEVQHCTSVPAFPKPEIKQMKRVKKSGLLQIFGLKRCVASYCESLSAVLSSWKLSTESSSPHRCVPSICSESQF
ncbi:hypothetical protein BDL97_16G008000 [Sphagnum fallax]|nr:hypothetical protein BDL97_16G008000 [Sphagnum fallax]KAH8937095.1 hypothetical protein BDL97_16G008000 [Sphagnum fallax]KAH8937099.1 hypothetical protein BDL97_16G008000 [Sphagnum fallax]KAH8937100.1 hypothetical protein BDL97_16G008000 [Sphagnum fallax]